MVRTATGALAGAVVGAAVAVVVRRRAVPVPVAPAPGLATGPAVALGHLPGRPPADAVVRAYRDARRAFGRWVDEPGPEALDELRDRTTALWYASTLAEPFLGGAKEVARGSRGILAALAERDDLLRLAEAARSQEALLGPAGVPRLDAFVARRRDRLEERIREQGRRTFRAKPSRLGFTPR